MVLHVRGMTTPLQAHRPFLTGDTPAVPADRMPSSRQLALDSRASRGSWGQWCQTLDGLAHQLTDPVAIFGMVGAGLTYRGLRLVLRQGLAHVGMGGSMVAGTANLLAFGGEAAMFPVYLRLGHQALGRPVSWGGEALGHDVRGSLLFLGGLRIFGSGARALFNGVHGISPHTGMAVRGVDYLAPSRTAFEQAGMLSGIMTGHGAELALGWREPLSREAFLAQSLTTLLHFNAAGRIIPLVTGQGLQRLSVDMEQTTRRWDRQMEIRARSRGAGPGGWSFAWAAMAPSKVPASASLPIPSLQGPQINLMAGKGEGLNPSRGSQAGRKTVFREVAGGDLTAEQLVDLYLPHQVIGKLDSLPTLEFHVDMLWGVATYGNYLRPLLEELTLRGVATLRDLAKFSGERLAQNAQMSALYIIEQFPEASLEEAWMGSMLLHKMMSASPTDRTSWSTMDRTAFLREALPHLKTARRDIFSWMDEGAGDGGASGTLPSWLTDVSPHRYNTQGLRQNADYARKFLHLDPRLLSPELGDLRRLAHYLGKSELTHARSLAADFRSDFPDYSFEELLTAGFFIRQMIRANPTEQLTWASGGIHAAFAKLLPQLRP